MIAAFLHDIELYGLWRGFRDLAKKEGPDADRLAREADAIREAGFEVLRNARSGSLYVARNAEVAREALSLEDRELAGGDPEARRRAIHRIGHLLGYPDCCAEAFAALPRQDDAFVMDRLLAPEPPASLPWLLDFLPPLVGPVIHYPCRLDCPECLQRATRLVDAWETDVPGTRERLRKDLSGPVLAAGRLDFLVLVGAMDGPERATYRGFRTASDYLPGMHPTDAFAAFLAKLPPEGTIEVRGMGALARDASGAVRAVMHGYGPRPRLLDYR